MEERIQLQQILLILRMQHCAIYSQMGSHDKALATAQHNLHGLKECLSNILETTSKLNSQDSKYKGEYGTVRFSGKIQRHLELLKSLISDISTNITIEGYAKR